MQTISDFIEESRRYEDELIGLETDVFKISFFLHNETYSS